VAVRNISDPIMLRYFFWSTSSPSASSSSMVFVLIGVGCGEASAISNFRSKSLVYLLWWTKEPCGVCLI
jgi:hypothetical protein